MYSNKTIADKVLHLHNSIFSENGVKHLDFLTIGWDGKQVVVVVVATSLLANVLICSQHWYQAVPASFGTDLLLFKAEHVLVLLNT